jgi:hypothetical protein
MVHKPGLVHLDNIWPVSAGVDLHNLTAVTGVDALYHAHTLANLIAHSPPPFFVFPHRCVLLDEGFPDR